MAAVPVVFVVDVVVTCTHNILEVHVGLREGPAEVVAAAAALPAWVERGVTVSRRR